MADTKGRPIIRPKEVEDERMKKRRAWLAGQRAPSPVKTGLDGNLPQKDFERETRRSRSRERHRYYSRERSPERHKYHSGDRGGDRDRGQNRREVEDRRYRERSRERARERDKDRDRAKSDKKHRREKENTRDKETHKEKRHKEDRGPKDREERLGKERKGDSDKSEDEKEPSPAKHIEEDANKDEETNEGEAPSRDKEREGNKEADTAYEERDVSDKNEHAGAIDKDATHEVDFQEKHEETGGADIASKHASREKERSGKDGEDRDKGTDFEHRSSKKAKDKKTDKHTESRRSKDKRAERRDYKHDRSRSRERDRRRRRSVSRSPKRRSPRKPSPSAGRYSYRDRRHRRSSSRDHDRRRRQSRSRSSSEEYGGYRPRERKNDERASGDKSPVSPAVPEPAPVAITPQQQMAQAQAWILQQQAASQAVIAANSKKNREIYVGNLTVGVVTVDMLKQLFDSAISAAFPHAALGGPPVVGVTQSADLKYAFVELRTEEMATAALQLNKLELCGRELNIARPSGYVDPAMAAVITANHFNPAAPLGVAGSTSQGDIASIAATIPSAVLVLANMLSPSELQDDQEYYEILEDIRTECSKHGALHGVVIAREGEPEVVGKAFIHFEDQAAAISSFQAIDGRHFDGKTIKASYCSVEEFNKIRRI